jgi:hypothetical protein
MSKNQDRQQRRLDLARKAFNDFFAQCFWSWQPNAEITEQTIPLIIRALRLHGGHKGYRIASELCQ